MAELWLSIASQAVAELIAPLSSLLVAAVTYLVWQATSWLTTKTRNERLQCALLATHDAVDVAVRAMEERLAPMLKQALVDGRVSPEEYTEMRTAALEAAKEQLGERGVANLKACAGQLDIDAWLQTRVDARIHDSHNSA